jgi:uncharacterized repeat protein (TIGR02543 family)
MGGTGSGATVVSLLEYTTSGTLQQTIALPNVTPRPTANPFNLMDAGSSTSHGQMARSSDGTAVVMPGYNGIATDSSIASSSAATVSRTIGVATPDGTVNTSRSYNMLSGNSFRSVASTDGTVFWAAGQPGMVYVNAVGTVASLSTVNTRVANIFNSQLYYSTGSGTVGIYSLGTGLPTSGSPSATLLIGTGSGSQPYGFALNASGTLCYIADDRASAAGGIQKWTSSGGTWTLAYTLGTGAANIGARGLIVDWSGANPVIYATSAETANNRIFRITDTGSGSSATTVASSGTGTVFRGIAFAPVSYTVTYDANGGTGSQTDPSSPYVAGTTVTVLGPGTIARSGYTFAGWNTAADGGGTPYNPSGTFIINANTTLYAQWCQNPTIFTVTGGDFYCSGGSGVEVGLDGSESGVSYQLYRNGGSTPVGSAVPGTGSAISFGNQTVADTYTVVGTRTAGGCSADMASSAVVVVTQDPLTWIHGNGAWNTDDSYWNDASSTAVTYCDGYNVIFGNSGTIDPLLITLDLTVSPASVTMTGDDIEYTIGGLGGIAGAGGLTKAGSRVCTLDTTNTYTGPTTINEGTLALGASGSIADSATISVAGGATFDVSAVSGFSLASGKTLKGNGTVSGTVTVAAGSTLAPGTSIGTIYFDTAPTLAGTTEMEVDKTAGTTDKLVVNTGGGTLTFGGTLSITWLTGSATAGDAYTLFEGASDASPKFSGAFSSITPTTPGTGLSWDTSTLTTDGKLRVTCAPVITSLSVPGACAGGAANLSVSVSGAGLNYAWRKRDASLGWGSGNGWQFAYHSGGCDGWNGVFVDSSTACGQNPGINANGKAFGLYAKSYNSAEAKRNFDTLQVAQTVRFDMQIPVYLEGSGDGNQSQCLVALRNSAAELAPRFEIWVKAGDTVLTVKDGAGETGTTIPYSSHGYRCVFKLTGADTYDLTVTVLATSTDYALAGRTLGGNSGDPINQFRAWS